MERLLNRYFPITDKPEGMRETHIQVEIKHITAAENPSERHGGFLYTARPVQIDDFGLIGVIFDGVQKPYVKQIVYKRNTEANRREILSAIEIARFITRAQLNCHDFGVAFDPQNFLPIPLD